MGLRGLEIGNAVGERQLDDPIFEPFFDAPRRWTCCCSFILWKAASIPVIPSPACSVTYCSFRFARR